MEEITLPLFKSSIITQICTLKKNIYIYIVFWSLYQSGTIHHLLLIIICYADI